MSFQIKNRYIAIIVLGAICGLIALGWVLGRAKGDRALQLALQRQDSTITVLKIKAHGAETTAYQNQQIITTQNAAIRAGELERATLRALHLKDLSEISRLKFEIDTLLTEVSHNGQIVVVHDTITQMPRNAILLPFSFEKKDKFLDLTGSFNSQAKLDISLNLSFDVDILSGLNKDKKRITSVLTDCPYVKTIGIKSFKFDEAKPKKWGVGFQIGYGLSLDNNPHFSPFLGIGIQRSIIIF